jgi:beta-lactam-binding protein with PASTA domain
MKLAMLTTLPLVIGLLSGCSANKPTTSDYVGNSGLEIKNVKVPNVVGLNHQTAQDTLQAKGFYLLGEEDSTGAKRLILWDRNWQVVRQSPKPDTIVDPDTTMVVLYSKKIGE